LKSGQSEVSFKDRNFGRLAPSLTVTVKNPILLSIPVCYVVTASNGLMLGALIINHSGCKHHFSAWVGEPLLWLLYCFSSLVKTCTLVQGFSSCPSMLACLDERSSAR